jgi:hypothetical protein
MESSSFQTGSKARQLLLAIPSNCASSVQIEVIEAAIVRARKLNVVLDVVPVQ